MNQEHAMMLYDSQQVRSAPHQLSIEMNIQTSLIRLWAGVSGHTHDVQTPHKGNTYDGKILHAKSCSAGNPNEDAYA